jgi:hypothetical protein
MTVFEWLFYTVLMGCAVGLVAVVFHSPVGEALAERVRKRGKSPTQSLATSDKKENSLQDELDALTTQIILIREELAAIKGDSPSGKR